MKIIESYKILSLFSKSAKDVFNVKFIIVTDQNNTDNLASGLASLVSDKKLNNYFARFTATKSKDLYPYDEIKAYSSTEFEKYVILKFFTLLYNL